MRPKPVLVVLQLTRANVRYRALRFPDLATYQRRSWRWHPDNPNRRSRFRNCGVQE